MTGVIEGDQRGVHTNRPFKCPEEIKNKARDHINSFPVMDSHYCRENTQRKYLVEGLSIATMYRMYLDEREENDPNVVSQSMYEVIFNTEFNLGLFTPKKDR